MQLQIALKAAKEEEVCRESRGRVFRRESGKVTYIEERFLNRDLKYESEEVNPREHSRQMISEQRVALRVLKCWQAASVSAA